MSVELRQTVSLVYDMVILGTGNQDWSIKKLFGIGLSGACPLATMSNIYIDITLNEVCYLTDLHVFNCFVCWLFECHHFREISCLSSNYIVVFHKAFKNWSQILYTDSFMILKSSIMHMCNYHWFCILKIKIFFRNVLFHIEYVFAVIF
jgi:hypothetical protein